MNGTQYEVIGRSMTSSGDPRLDRDATDLRAALSELIRIYQFRERGLECCRRDLTPTQSHALDVIGNHGPLSLNELAARLYIDKSTTSRVVDALERKGFARRDENPEDRRALLITVTPAGEELLVQMREEILAKEKELLAGFEPAIRREMTRLIGRLARAAAARVESDGE